MHQEAAKMFAPIPVIDDAAVLQNGAKYPLVLLSPGATSVST
jgi:hypothetical protein